MQKGTVDNIDTRSVILKRGPRAGASSTAYDVYIDGTKYAAGFNRPTVAVGDVVEFDYSTTKYGPELSFIRAAGTVKGNGHDKAATPTTRSYQSKPFPVPVDHGDRSIIRQNSLTNARELVSATLVWRSGPSGKKGMETLLDELSDEVIRLAYKFEEYSAGDRERRAADKLMDQGTAESE